MISFKECASDGLDSADECTEQKQHQSGVVSRGVMLKEEEVVIERGSIIAEIKVCRAMMDGVSSFAREWVEQRYKYPWWESDQLEVLIWGQLNDGLLIMERKLFERAVRHLLELERMGLVEEQIDSKRSGELRNMVEGQYQLRQMFLHKFADYKSPEGLTLAEIIELKDTALKSQQNVSAGPFRIDLKGLR